MSWTRGIALGMTNWLPLAVVIVRGAFTSLVEKAETLGHFLLSLNHY